MCALVGWLSASQAADGARKSKVPCSHGSFVVFLADRTNCKDKSFLTELGTLFSEFLHKSYFSYKDLKL